MGEREKKMIATTNISYCPFGSWTIFLADYNLQFSGHAKLCWQAWKSTWNNPNLVYCCRTRIGKYSGSVDGDDVIQSSMYQKKKKLLLVLSGPNHGTILGHISHCKPEFVAIAIAILLVLCYCVPLSQSVSHSSNGSLYSIRRIHHKSLAF